MSELGIIYRGKLGETEAIRHLMLIFGFPGRFND